MKDFSIIVALDKNRGIGKDGGLAWHLPSDMKHFKKVTTRSANGKINAVIMGRKTWESIPERFRPLSDRINVILTRKEKFHVDENCLVFGGIEGALENLSQRPDVDKIFVIGGASLYAQAIEHSLCKLLYVTKIEEVFDCDVFFPDFKKTFQLLSQDSLIIENQCHFSFQQYGRLSNTNC